MSERGKDTGGSGTPQAGGGPAQVEIDRFARFALELNGIALTDADVGLVAAEFGRALEIVKPLLDFPLPDGLDQAGVYRA